MRGRGPRCIAAIPITFVGMPKVLVLFSGAPEDIGAVADAIADGAASVKFTEVEVRRIGGVASPSLSETGNTPDSLSTVAARRYRALESVESIATHDALIVVNPVGEDSAGDALTQILEQAGSPDGRALMDKVGSAFSPALSPPEVHETTIMSMLIPMMRLGMIIVPPGFSDRPAVARAMAQGSGTAAGAASSTADVLAAARRQGARVAKVAEWVRHAKSHEAHGH